MYGVMLFGDSIAFGRGNLPSYSWAILLKQEFEKHNKFNTFYNLAIPGETSTTLLKRFNTEVKARAAYKRKDDHFHIIISIGMNDCKGINSEAKIQVPKKTYRKNIKKLVSQALKHTPHITIIGLTAVDEDRTQPYENTFFSNERILEYNEILREVALENNLQFIDVFELSPKEIADGVHPNRKGQKKIFKKVHEELHL
ncbi:MAG: SGNH/GDSL hydrolase family protein [Nanoarchaeota archaeon]